MMLGLCVLVLCCIVTGHANRGYALSFQGRTAVAGIRKGIVDFTDEGFKDLSYNFTVGTWVRFSNTANYAGTAFRFVSTADNYLFDLQQGGSWITSDGGLYYEPYGEVMPANTWVFVTATIENGYDLTSYLNGVETSKDTIYRDWPTNFAQANSTIYFGALLYSHGPINEVVRSNTAANFRGSIDDFSLWSRVLSVEEINELMNSPVNKKSPPPDLVLYYDFDMDDCQVSGVFDDIEDPLCEDPQKIIVKNYGVSGDGYDLLRGQLNDDFGFGREYMSSSGGADLVPFDMPVFSVSNNPYKVAAGRTGAWVYQVAVNTSTFIDLRNNISQMTIRSIPENATLFRASNNELVGTNTNITGEHGLILEYFPNFTSQSFVVEYGGVNQSIHLVQHREPVALETVIERNVLEDQELKIELGSFLWSSTAEITNVTLTEFPEDGYLEEFHYNLHEWISRGRKSESHPTIAASGGLIIAYQPLPDFHGQDKFAFEFSSHGFTSKPVTVNIYVESYDDFPVVTMVTNTTVAEDTTSGVNISLTASDAEETFGLSLVIDSLPKKGNLYIYDDDDQSLMRVDSKYSEYNFGRVFSQYGSRVLKASSFSVYSFQDHPFGVLGPPSCDYSSIGGECSEFLTIPNDGILPIGQRIFFPFRDQIEGVQASIIRHVSGLGYDSVYDIKPLPVWKWESPSNHTYVRCAFDFQGKGVSDYPSSCHKLEPDQDDQVIHNVSFETMLSGLGSYYWVPRFNHYSPENVLDGGEESGMYAPELYFYHNQSEYYNRVHPDAKNGPRYTEFLEIEFETPVYPVAFEIVFPRGGGCLVSLKAWHKEDSKWQSMYVGEPDIKKYEETTEKGYVFKFDEMMCRPTFKTSRVRLELDTSKETGIADWNHIDYVALYGAEWLDASILRSHIRKVLYVPNEDEFGSDSFTFSALDCLGNKARRTNQPGTVYVNITPVPDRPKAFLRSDETNFTTNIDETITIRLYGSDNDGGPLSVVVTSIPVSGALSTGNYTTYIGPGSLVAEKLDMKSGEVWTTVEFTPGSCGDFKDIYDNFTFEIIDEEGLHSLPKTVHLAVKCSTARYSTLLNSFIIIGVIAPLCALGLIYREHQSNRRRQATRLDSTPKISVEEAAKKWIWRRKIFQVLFVIIDIYDLLSDIASLAYLYQRQDTSKGILLFYSFVVSLTLVFSVDMLRARWIRFMELSEILSGNVQMYSQFSHSTRHSNNKDRESAGQIAVHYAELLSKIILTQKVARQAFIEDLPSVGINAYIIFHEDTAVGVPVFPFLSLTASLVMLGYKLTHFEKIQEYKRQKDNLERFISSDGDDGQYKQMIQSELQKVEDETYAKGNRRWSLARGNNRKIRPIVRSTTSKF